MFPNNITLHDNKRCKAKEDQIKIKNLTKEIRNSSDKKELINILKSNLK